MMSRNLQRRGGAAVLAVVLNVFRTPPEFALATTCGNVNKYKQKVCKICEGGQRPPII